MLHLPQHLLPAAFSSRNLFLALAQQAGFDGFSLNACFGTNRGLINFQVFPARKTPSSTVCRPFSSNSSRTRHVWQEHNRAVDDLNSVRSRFSNGRQEYRCHMVVPHRRSTAHVAPAVHSATMQQRGLAVISTPLASASSRVAGTLDEDSLENANSEARAITCSICNASHLQQLREIVAQQRDSFNSTHTAAAFSKAAKLAGGRGFETGDADGGFLQLLAPAWQRCLQEAAPRELASVMYACTKLAYTDQQLWSSTLSAFAQPHILERASAQDLCTAAAAVTIAATAVSQLPSASASQSMAPLTRQGAAAFLQTVAKQLAMLLRSTAGAEASWQSISCVIRALGKLNCSLAEPELLMLMQALAQRIQPASATEAEAEAIASSLWSVSHMQQLQTAVQQQHHLPTQQKPLPQKQAQQAEGHGVWGQLLGQELLAKIAQSNPQAVSDTLLALGRLSSGAWHPISMPFAQHCAEQLLHGDTVKHFLLPTAGTALKFWKAKDIGDSMWACAKLGIKSLHVFDRAAAAPELWLPYAAAPVLSQVAWACAKRKYRNEKFIESIMQQGRHLMHRNHGHVPLLPDQAERTALAATLCWAVATLNLTHLAGDIKALVAASGIKQQEQPLSAADARALWCVHGWLHHHRLLGGHGLAKLLSEQQLASCAEASRHTHRHTPLPHIATKLKQQQQQQIGMAVKIDFCAEQ